MDSKLANVCINTIRFLSADAVQKANSGHPGLPMGTAAIAYVLWTQFLKHNPANPDWADRDRFVLSAGHGSMLLYSLLHLTGYDVSLEEIKNFRQWGSRTPGHPESHLTPGVETTTGPLGQGISNAVGMAIAEAHLSERFNRPGHEVVNHYTYVLAGDGDLMEGVASEACSLAGHLKLGKLIVVYDSNRISLAGSTALSFSEDVARRFQGYGWHSVQLDDGNQVDDIRRALQTAQGVIRQPSLIIAKTHIGFGSPNKQDTYQAHGSPLGEEELKLAKETLKWPVTPSFHIPAEALQYFRNAMAAGAEKENHWKDEMISYADAYPELASELNRRIAGDLPTDWDRDLPCFEHDDKGLATRKASEKVMQSLASRLPELVGGSADLNPSTYTWLKGEGDFENRTTSSVNVQGVVGDDWSYGGRNLHFGVREHGMAAAVNGMARHGGFIPYGSTFLVFSDYMRPALRLSAIMEIQCIWVCTHDGIGVGEDGPTHQAVEQYMALRAIPNFLFFRPCDANETVWAWRVAISNRHRPSLLSLTRQKVPTLDRSKYSSAEGVARGAYVLNPQESDSAADIMLLATGSEVQHIVGAAALLAAEGVKARLVSMPCWKLFEEQTPEYREKVLPKSIKARIAVETGVSMGWHRWIGDQGLTITLDRYGVSAPGPRIMKEFGFTAENIAGRASNLLRHL